MSLIYHLSFARLFLVLKWWDNFLSEKWVFMEHSLSPYLSDPLMVFLPPAVKVSQFNNVFCLGGRVCSKKQEHLRPWGPEGWLKMRKWPCIISSGPFPCAMVCACGAPGLLTPWAVLCWSLQPPQHPGRLGVRWQPPPAPGTRGQQQSCQAPPLQGWMQRQGLGVCPVENAPTWGNGDISEGEKPLS